MESPLDVLARTAGGVLSSGAIALGAARDRTKPLHPDGRLRRATVSRTGGAARTGVPWLDTAGTDDALVRVSRAIGLPEVLPDISGLAIRIRPDDAPADLLLASTGLGRLTRYVLAPTRHPARHPLSTLLPYQSPGGPLLLAARPESDLRLTLCWARPVGPWVPFGAVDLGEPLGDDTSVSFDPVVNVLPGLRQYGWVKRLREPAYFGARRRTRRTLGSQPTRA
jgi:hypothetical protein